MKRAPALSLRNQAGQFSPGSSGNPSGKGRGTRSLLHRALDDLAGVDAQDVLRTVLDKAKAGDVSAARLILNRAWSVPKGRPAEVDIPAIDTAGDLIKAMSAIVRAVSEGHISTDEARDLSLLVEALRKTHELVDIERRVVALEQYRAPAQTVGQRGRA